MDNITHSLFGYVLGQAAPHRVNPSRKAAILTAVLGSNIPDIDVLLLPLFGQGSIGNLLHHRGYSHTFLLSLPLGVVSAWVATRVFKVESKMTWKLVLIGWLAVLLHIAADASNNYGVHPFSPFWNRWFYGDFIFILEPLYWLACLPFVFFVTESKTLRTLAGITEVLLLALIWTRFFNPTLIAVALSFWGIFFIFLNFKIKSPIPCFLGVFFTLVAFGLGKEQATRQIEMLPLQLDSSSLRDSLTLTPAPGNPLCWSFLITSVTPSTGLQQDYVTRMGILSLSPWISHTHCFFRSEVQRATPLSPVDLPISVSSPFHWIGEFRRPLQDLQSLRHESCRFNAFLQFARVPVWYLSNGEWMMGDLRYDSGKRAGFARLKMYPDLNRIACPQKLPGWTPPLSRILEHFEP